MCQQTSLPPVFPELAIFRWTVREVIFSFNRRYETCQSQVSLVIYFDFIQGEVWIQYAFSHPVIAKRFIYQRNTGLKTTDVMIKHFSNRVLLLPIDISWTMLAAALHEFEPGFILKREQPEEQRREDSILYDVEVNHEEQYFIWPDYQCT